MAQVESGWREYIGVTRTTQVNGVAPLIECFVPEFLPNEENKIPNTQIKKGQVVDPLNGQVGCYCFKRTEAVVCTFLGDSNHIIPCVHKGERVRVLNFDGTQQYYWLPLGRDPGIRRHEHMRWFAMAQPKAITGPDNYKTVTDDNTYFVDINTNEGHKEIHIHTSKIDGEPFKYDMRIMPEKGIWEFIDCQGNVLRLNTYEHWWYMRNVDDSILELKREDINITCKDTMTINADQHIYITTPDYHLTANEQTVIGDNRSETFSATHAIEAGNAVTVEAGAIYSVEAPDLSYEGSHAFTGPSFVCATSQRSI